MIENKSTRTTQIKQIFADKAVQNPCLSVVSACFCRDGFAPCHDAAVLRCPDRLDMTARYRGVGKEADSSTPPTRSSFAPVGMTGHYGEEWGCKAAKPPYSPSSLSHGVVMSTKALSEVEGEAETSHKQLKITN